MDASSSEVAAAAGVLVSEYGPHAVAIAVLTAFRKVPRLVAKAVTATDEVIALFRKLGRFVDLATKWLEQQVGAHPSKEIEIYRRVDDTDDVANEEDLIEELAALAPDDSLPLRLGRHGKQILRLADQVKKRRGWAMSQRIASSALSTGELRIETALSRSSQAASP